MARFYSVHAYNLRPEVSRGDFERFMTEEWIPYVMKRKGCRGAMLLKGYTGEWMAQKMDYATIEIWENAKANRDAWGGPKREWVAPADLKPFMDQFRGYCVPESFRTLEFELVS